MLRQMTLDGKVRETEVQFYMNGYERQLRGALNHSDGDGVYVMRLSGGRYNEKTDQIDIYLDIVEQALFSDRSLDCEDPDTFFCEELARILAHEHVHSVLNTQVSNKACRTWDSDFIYRTLGVTS
jgi:hypothetical protein